MSFNFSNLSLIIISLLILILCLLFFPNFFSKQKLDKKVKGLEKKETTLNVNYRSLFQLGLVYLQKKSYDKAIEYFRESLNSWNNNDKLSLGVLYNKIGFCYYKINELDIARYYYEKAIIILPDYIVALNNLAILFEKNLQNKKAAILYKQILVHDVNNIKAIERYNSLINVKSE